MQKKSEKINMLIFLLLIPIVLICGYFFSDSNQYYITAAIIVIAAIVPFFISFERGKSKTREIVTIASMTAIAVVSRAAFYMLPQIKPIGAVVIIAAVSFGYEAGFMIGAMSMFLSNIIFGQGAWTPFQMLGMGLVGVLGNLILSHKKIKSNRWLIGIIGGLLIFTVYGIIVDTSSVLMMSSDFSVGSVLAFYASGVPFNAIFGITTAVILILFGKPLTEKLERVKIKYGVFNTDIS